MSKETERLIRRNLLLIMIGFITFVVPLSLGLGAGGFDTQDVLTQFSFYFMTAAAFIFLMFITINTAQLIKSKYGNFLLFSTPGNTPWKFFKGMTNFQMVWASTILFGALGVLAVTKNVTFTGLVSVEQQFTKTAQLLFSASLIPGSENLGLAFVIGFVIIFFTLLAIKLKMTKENYSIILVVLVVLSSMFYWGINHLLRYAGQDVNIMIVIFFGATMAVLTLLTGSFIPAWIMHIANNFFYDLKNLFASDVVIVNTFIIIGILAVGYYFVYRGRLFSGKKVKRKK